MPIVRTSLLAILLTGAALAAPSSALAAINLSSAGGVTTITADPGTADHLNVQQSTCTGGGLDCYGTAVRVDSDTTPLVATQGGGCFIYTRNGFSQGICPASTTINVDTGDGDDIVSASENARAPPPVWNINLGDGNDTTEYIETDGINTIDGGPGDDTIDGENIIFGGDGNDTPHGRDPQRRPRQRPARRRRRRPAATTRSAPGTATRGTTSSRAATRPRSTTSSSATTARTSSSAAPAGTSSTAEPTRTPATAARLATRTRARRTSPAAARRPRTSTSSRRRSSGDRAPGTRQRLLGLLAAAADLEAEVLLQRVDLVERGLLAGEDDEVSGFFFAVAIASSAASRMAWNSSASSADGSSLPISS